MSESLVKDLAWSISDYRKNHSSVSWQYRLKNLNPEHWHSSNVNIGKLEKTLEVVIDKFIQNMEQPSSYTVFGKKIQPFYEVSALYRVCIGKDAHGNPDRTLKLITVIKHPSEYEKGPEIELSDHEFTIEIRDTISMIDEIVLGAIKESIVRRFHISKDEIPEILFKHVFIAYREGNDLSKAISKKFGKYLTEKK